MSTATRAAPDPEAEIRAVVDRWVEAFRRRDVDAAVAVHAEHMVSFDIVPPLSYRGVGDYRAAWDAMFALFEGPIVMRLRDLSITVRESVAFSHSLNRFTATTTGGDVSDYWFRWTACFEQRGDRWLIVHDHASLPTDFATGDAVQTLAP